MGTIIISMMVVVFGMNDISYDKVGIAKPGINFHKKKKNLPRKINISGKRHRKEKRDCSV